MFITFLIPKAVVKHFVCLNLPDNPVQQANLPVRQTNK